MAKNYCPTYSHDMYLNILILDSNTVTPYEYIMSKYVCLDLMEKDEIDVTMCLLISIFSVTFLFHSFLD